MPMKLLSADDFRAAAKEGTTTDGTVFRFATAEPKDVEGAARTKRFVFSDASVDHSNDSIDPQGWDLKVFNRNPVALFSHMSWEPPIGRAANVKVQNDQLVGDIEFAMAEVYEFADTIYRLVDGGFLNAVSVGFKPKEWVFSADKNRPYGIDFKKQTLLEISVCPVPCNPNALSEARSIGIDTRSLVEWAEKVLDTGDVIFMPKAELETLRSQAGAPEKRYYIQVPDGRAISAETAEKVRDHVKRWQNDPSDVLILGEGLVLRTVGEPETPPEEASPADVADEEKLLVEIGEILIDEPTHTKIGPAAAALVLTKVRATIAKAGRRISAKTKSVMEEAIGHHDMATKCLRDAMDADCEPDGDENDIQDESKVVPPAPPADVVDEDAGLTAEERRLKEAKALKASLPQND